MNLSVPHPKASDVRAANKPRDKPENGPGLGSATGNPRNKVALKPGHSLMDWIRLGKSGRDLTGVNGQKLEVTSEELARHGTKEDAWMAIKGYVYNVTAYMDFHPGGCEELMRGVGKDSTSLFNEVHRWVNFQSMLAPCLVGKLKDIVTFQKPGMKAPTVRPPRKPTEDSLRVVTSRAESQSSINLDIAPTTPKFDWFQTDKTVTLVIYSKWKSMRHENILIDRPTLRQLVLTVFIQEIVYTLNIDLEHELEIDYRVKVGHPGGKVEVTICKSDPDKHWSQIGKPLDRHVTFKNVLQNEVTYRLCSIISKESITHDTKLFALALPHGCRMCIPVGYHVLIKCQVDDVEVVRSYTVVPPKLYPSSADLEVDTGKKLYLMIKIYPDGILTSKLDNLQIGDQLPVSNFDGNFDNSRLAECDHLVMYAAGTGFTPMVGLLVHWAHLQDSCPSSRQAFLMFFNKTEADILWKEQLENMASRYPNFTVEHVLSQAGNDWQGLTGRIRQELLQGHAPKPDGSRRMLFCACGPNPFTNEAVHLAEVMGYPKSSIHAFQG